MPLPAIIAGGALAISAIGAVANAWTQYQGLKSGRRENRRTQALQQEMYNRAEKARKTERKEDIAIRKEEFAETKSWNRFQKRQAFLDTVLTQFNTNPQLTNNFVAAQRGRQ